MELTAIATWQWALAAAGLVVVWAIVAAWLAAARHRRLGQALTRVLEQQDRLERQWHVELDESQRDHREELARGLAGVRHDMTLQFDALRQQQATDTHAGRSELTQALDRFMQQSHQQWQQLTEINDRRLQELRHTLEARLHGLQQENAAKLDDMRRLVDEKLHATLEQRLGESFRIVSERLEAVHRGLGDMRQLAADVGDLQRVLVNVKSRGTWGEVQLARLVGDVMTPDQYGLQVKPIPGRSEVVECAIRLPGRSAEAPLWLPIDAKFPRESFERLLTAEEQGDEAAIRQASVALERVVEVEARRIAGKYVSPPHTTDFAVMFLATEGLYAEVLRRPGLFDRLQALRITVAGPSTLAAMLNSLQMGFRTLAIEQRSAEVWQVLRAVKTEFDKFGENLAQVKKSLESASQRIGQTETRTRVMLRNLRAVEALPGSSSPPGSQPEGEPVDDTTAGASDDESSPPPGNRTSADDPLP